MALLFVGSGCILDNPDFDGESASAGEMTLSTGSETSPTTSLDTTPATSSTGASLSDTEPTEPTSSPATSGSSDSETTDDATTESTTTLGTTSLDTTSSTGGETSDPGNDPCGDGELGADEECDDGNALDGDGCSAMCHVEPVAISLGGLGWSMKAGTPGVDAENHSAWCPDDKVLRTFTGERDAETNNRLCRPSAGCTQLVVDPDLSVSSQSDESFGPFDGGCPQPSAPWERSCPDGHVLVSAAGRASDVITQLEIGCAPVLITEDENGFSITHGPVTTLDPVGPPAGLPFETIGCPQDSIAMAAELNVGAWIYALNFSCKVLILEYP